MAKILLIEDHDDTRELVKLALEARGHIVIEAVTADIGIELARKELPDIILMDINLPGTLNGLEATKLLREDGQFDSVPIIALTAHAMKGDKDRILAAGCDAHWAKPIIDLEQFQTMIANTVAEGRKVKTPPQNS